MTMNEEGVFFEVQVIGVTFHSHFWNFQTTYINNTKRVQFIVQRVVVVVHLEIWATPAGQSKLRSITK